MILSSYTKALRRYDKDLFAGRTKDGLPCVFRRIKRFEPVIVSDELTILSLKESAQFLFALTHNWTAGGQPRAWGIDNVVRRAGEIDTQSNERLLDEMDEQNEKVDQSKRRALRNEMEAFFADERKGFAKAFDEIAGCTHSLSKDEPRKRLKDRSIKNGNY